MRLTPLAVGPLEGIGARRGFRKDARCRDLFVGGSRERRIDAGVGGDPDQDGEEPGAQAGPKVGRTGAARSEEIPAHLDRQGADREEGGPEIGADGVLER